MKGIILSGGAGSRLHPMTKVITKQLLPIYDKPMIYYPMSVLMMCHINEILLITTREDQPHFQKLLGDGSEIGLKLSYIIQDAPNGIAQAYTLAEEFLKCDDSMLVLGDNLFYGRFSGFREAIRRQKARENGIQAQVFAYAVNDPERYGVVEFDKSTGKVQSIEEKPENPKSNYAIPGVYLLDGSAPERVKNQKPSARGELEITDLIQTYLDADSLGVEVINRGIAWLDTGTPQSLLEASSFVAAIEQRQGLKTACLEEIALRAGFIDIKKFHKIIENSKNNNYTEYLKLIAKEHEA